MPCSVLRTCSPEPMRSLVLAAAGALTGQQPPAPPRLAVNLTLTPPGYGLAPLPNASAALVFRGVPPGDGRVRSASITHLTPTFELLHYNSSDAAEFRLYSVRWSSQSTCCNTVRLVLGSGYFLELAAFPSFQVPPCRHLFITSNASLSNSRLCECSICSNSLEFANGNSKLLIPIP